MAQSTPAKNLNEKNTAKRAEAAADLAALVNTLGPAETLASLSCNELRGFCGRLSLGASRRSRQDMMVALSKYLETPCPTSTVASGRAQNRRSTTPRPRVQRPNPGATGKAKSKAVVRSKRKATGSVQAPVRRIRQKQPETTRPEPAQVVAPASADLNEMTVRDLRRKARELFVGQHGNKEDLIERIAQAVRVRATIGAAGAGAASALTAAVAAATAAHGVDAWPQAFEKQVRALNSACAQWGGEPIGDDLPARSALERSIGRLEALSGGLSGRKGIVIRDGF